MNAPFDTTNRFLERKANELAAIRNLQAKLNALLDELESEPVNASFAKRECVEYARLAAADAAHKVWPDAGMKDEIDMLTQELGLDAEGYPLDAMGEPLPDDGWNNYPDRAMPLGGL